MKEKQGKMPIAYFKTQRVKSLVNYLEKCESNDMGIVFNDTKRVYRSHRISAASAETMAYTARRMYKGNYIWRNSFDNLIIYITDKDQFWFVYRVQLENTNL